LELKNKQTNFKKIKKNADLLHLSAKVKLAIATFYYESGRTRRALLQLDHVLKLLLMEVHMRE
jgi:hypothetical protein